MGRLDGGSCGFPFAADRRIRFVPVPASAPARRDPSGVSLTSAGLKLNVFERILLRDGVSGEAAVFYVKIDRFSDICESLIAGIPLRDTARKYRHRNDIPAVCFLFENNRILHFVRTPSRYESTGF